MEKEIRSINEINSIEAESRTIEGYALVFNSLSHDLGGFYEKIDRNALDGVLERSTILALLNHDESRGILAKFRNMQGSLSLEIDDKGLKYSFDAPHTQLGDELIEGLKRGDINTSSFAFTIADEEWSKDEVGNHIRTIKHFDRLFDVSPVYNEAYGDTTVALRKLGEITEQEQRAIEELNEKSENEKNLDKYYKELKNNLF